MTVSAKEGAAWLSTAVSATSGKKRVVCNMVSSPGPRTSGSATSSPVKRGCWGGESALPNRGLKRLAKRCGQRSERTTVAVFANVTMPQIPKRGRGFSAIVDCKGFGFLRPTMTLLDLNLFGVMLISALLAARRGLIRFVVGVVCCGIAMFFTDLFAVNFFKGDDMLLWLESTSVFFSCLLIALLALAASILHSILDSRANLIGSTLGFLLGLVRGFVVAVVAFLVIDWLIPFGSQPDWVRNAASYRTLTEAGQWLMSLFPENIDDRNMTPFQPGIGLIVDTIVLSVGVDLFAIVSRWMGRS